MTGFQCMQPLRGFAERNASNGTIRKFHICLNPDSLEAHPELLDIVADAGMHQIWLPAFFYGYWPYPHEERHRWHQAIEAKGLASSVINIPLGHPGDSLGAMHGNVPLTPPEHWSMGQYPDGTHYAGTSLHPPATEENVAAMELLAKEQVTSVFLDDDFRLAVSPSLIGGCFCEQHRQQFLASRGYEESRWDELLEAVHHRNPTAVLREWITFTCDELTESFSRQQAAAPGVVLGNMVMYLGSEKAGIRLPDYRNTLFRVGESKFNDAAFAPIKGKTDALFSCLFHRRFAQPELAFSETTAYPADQLSARNLAAKLAISTLADVRNTMFMSGLTPYPIDYWDTIAPAMWHNAALHETVAGHRPQGPLKHYWGDYSRLVGTDNPYSLFLALGVPFEVCDVPAEDGWTFLSDEDAQGLTEGAFCRAGSTFIARHEVNNAGNELRAVPESMDALFELKHEIVEQLDAGIPYIVEDLPIICAWYPSADTVLLWNPAEHRVSLTLRWAGRDRAVEIDPLALISMHSQ